MKLFGAFLASVLLSSAAAAVPLGSDETAAAYSAKQILAGNPAAASGSYWIDPDGHGGSDPFQIYADMTTFGGGWTLGVHSILGSKAPSTDMAANLGTFAPTSGYTRDLSLLAIDNEAQIRHRMVAQNGTVLFDGYYTGRYHDPLGSQWTVLIGDVQSAGLAYHIGQDWTTASDDLDNYGPANCAHIFGNQPWYYNMCWTAHPTSGPWASGPEGAGQMLASYDIFVRELVTPPLETTDPEPTPVPEPAALGLLGLGVLGLALRRRRR